MALGTFQTASPSAQGQVSPSSGVGDSAQRPPAPPSLSDEESDSQRAEVKTWCDRIKKAKKKFDKDFKRMEKNQAFASGVQWDGQDALDTAKYVANITLRSISQKVSTLYAKDPQAVPRRRERLDYQLWDGKMESLMAAMGVVSQSMQTVGIAPPEALALLQDFQNGQALEQMLDKVARTMKILYHYQIDEQEPEFKEQLKQLVLIVCICGVGYARMSFVRDMTTPIGSTALGGDAMDRVKQLRMLTEKYEKDNCDAASPVMEQIRLLSQSLMSDAMSQMQGNPSDSIESERIVWDFPSPCSIIVDPACKSLMNFIGAKWLAQEYLLPPDEINSYFELRGKDMVKPSAEVTKYASDGKEEPTENQDGKADSSTTALCCVWEVFNSRNKERFFIVDGHKDYIQPPAPLTPKLKRFFPVFALTFNRIAAEPGSKVSIYPPSDVDLLRPMQKEWNRSRNEMRGHRIQNSPAWVASKAAGLTDSDKDKIKDLQSGEIIELNGVLPGQDIRQVLMAFPTQQIRPECYDTSPLLQDTNLVIGAQAADLGTQQSGDTATGQQISEQARLSTTSSNVDDLDGFLTRMARAGGEMLLREMSPQTVTKIVGPGAVWPQTEQDKENFLNALYLETEAASSGRPNEALNIKKWQAVAPILQAAGANPQFMVRKSIETFDAKIEPAEAFPLLPPAQPGQNAAKPSQPDEQKGGPQPQADAGRQPENPRNQHQQPTV